MTYLARYWAWLKAEKLLPLLVGIFLFRLILTPIGILTQNRLGEFTNDWKVVPQHISKSPLTQVTEAWVSWDSNWYAKIAGEGYTSRGEPFSKHSNQDIAFFPVYPMSIRALHTLGIPIELAGLVISTFSTVAIVSFGYLLLRSRKLSASLSRLVLIMLFAHPIGYILGAMLSEPLFLALALGALYAWQKQRYALFWVVGLLVGMSRPPGLLLCIPGFIQIVEAKFWKTPVYEWVKKGIALTGPIVGFISYMLYVHHRTGLWDAFSRSEAVVWGRHQSLLHIVTNLFVKPFAGVNWLFFALFAWVTIVAVLLYRKRIGNDLVAWSLFMLVGPLMTMLVGMPRYTVTIFPLAMALAFLTEKRPRLKIFILTAMISSQVILYVLWVMNAQLLQ